MTDLASMNVVLLTHVGAMAVVRANTGTDATAHALREVITMLLQGAPDEVVSSFQNLQSELLETYGKGLTPAAGHA